MYEISSEKIGKTCKVNDLKSWNVNKRRKFPIENYEHLKQTELWNYAIIHRLDLWDMT